MSEPEDTTSALPLTLDRKHIWREAVRCNDLNRLASAALALSGSPILSEELVEAISEVTKIPFPEKESQSDRCLATLLGGARALRRPASERRAAAIEPGSGRAAMNELLPALRRPAPAHCHPSGRLPRSGRHCGAARHTVGVLCQRKGLICGYAGA